MGLYDPVWPTPVYPCCRSMMKMGVLSYFISLLWLCKCLKELQLSYEKTKRNMHRGHLTIQTVQVKNYQG